MKVLSASHMFPNSIYPYNGIFVKERIRNITKKVDVKVVAPVPFFPFINFSSKYQNINKVLFKEDFEGLCVLHPRYFLIPKYFKFFDGYFYYWSLNKYVRNIINENKIDLLDFHWVYPDAFAGLKWARRFGKKIIVTIRGNESIYYFEKSLRKRMLIKVLQSVDHIISVSNDLKTKVVNEYKVSSDKISVIPNGIDKDKFYRIDKLEAKKMCGLQLDKKYIFSLSRLSPEKGLENLLEAFSEIQNNDINLLIGGDGNLKKKLVQIARDLDIDSRVQFLGAIPHKDTYKWYNAADIYCLPSLWEGCPNTVIEALACGTPVVATRVGGIPDLVNQKTGILVPPKDISALSKSLDEALNIEWNRREIAAIGQSNSWDNVADRVIEVYKKVLS